MTEWLGGASLPAAMTTATRLLLAAFLFGGIGALPLLGGTGPPTIVGAASPASGQIRVGWHFRNTDQTGPRYDAFRALGTCGAPGVFSPVATQLNALSYLDNGLLDRQSYAYEIESTGAPGVRSACVEARPGDPCVAPPLFPGLAAVNDAQIQCGLILSAADAVPLCGASAVHDFYRSTTSGFVPGKANQIVFHGTSNGTIDTNVLNGVTYYYVQRAVDTGNGVQEQNLVEKSGIPLHCGPPPPPPSGRYYTVLPCRLVDSRRPDGTFGGPALAPSAARTFPIAGSCGVPATAKAVALCISITEPAAPGNLALYAADLASPPLASAVNFSAGQTRTNEAIVTLSASGGALSVFNRSAGAIHAILDVEGYFD